MEAILPEELELDIYKKYEDLKKFSDQDLRRHFTNHGIQEGRITNSITSRHDFIKLLPEGASVLEIGPFYSPVVKGQNVKYFDVLSTEELVSRATALNINTENIPTIHFVDRYGDLGVIHEKFDIVISSHSIEHQPDLVVHLQKVERLLNPGGRYFILAPDKRYVFDHFIPETTVADILSKHLQGVTTHSLKSVIEHRAMTTHNDPARHWAGDHGIAYDNFAYRAKAAIKEYEDAKGGYVDVHASYFTPASFGAIIRALIDLGLINMEIERIYHTRRNQNEFFAILKKK